MSPERARKVGKLMFTVLILAYGVVIWFDVRNNTRVGASCAFLLSWTFWRFLEMSGVRRTVAFWISFSTGILVMACYWIGFVLSRR